MSKKLRDDQINVRVSRPLRAVLEEAASADERVLSDLVRKLLIEFAAKYLAVRASTGVV
jgi:uncharacterized protein (DUF1778 family)